MRSTQKSGRSRGRGNRKPNGNSANRVYDSSGPEGKVRGTPQQIIDKYLSLARDAQTSGDRVTAENFLQHAEHYQRILIEANAHTRDQRRETTEESEEEETASAQPRPARPPEAETEQPRAAEPVVGGMTTIGDEPEAEPLLVAENEVSASQPSGSRRSRTRSSRSRRGENGSAEQPAEGNGALNGAADGAETAEAQPTPAAAEGEPLPAAGADPA